MSIYCTVAIASTAIMFMYWLLWVTSPANRLFELVLALLIWSEVFWC